MSKINFTAGQRPTREDSGAILGFVLIFFVFVGLTVVATLTFASTLMRNRPPINERNARVEAVRSAMRMAIQFQRDYGVNNCFDDDPDFIALPDPFVFNEGTPEEVTTTVNCATPPPEQLQSNYFREGGDAFALITTMRDDSFPSISGSKDIASKPTKLIEGNVFIAGGDFTVVDTPPRENGDDILIGNQTGGVAGRLLTTRLTGPRYSNGVTLVDCDDPLIGPYLPSSGTVAGTAHSNVPACTDLEWTERAGTRIHPATTWTYPNLPGIPVNNRPVWDPRGFPINDPTPDCEVIFPGRYTDPVNFDSGGEYYLTSGVYYFTQPVTVSNGSKVVAGEGREAGCVVDTTALLDKRIREVETTSITGRGATFLLDDNASVTVDDGQLFMNRRISTPSTRGSEGVSIRSVQASEINTASLYVPEDDVVTGVDTDGNRILEEASSYSYDDNGVDIEFVGLSAPDVDVPLVTADFRGQTGSALVVDGSIFVPQGKFTIAADNPNFKVQLDGGVVAARADLDISVMPASANDWYFGVDASPLLQRVELEATATVSGKTARSVAVFQINSIGDYAINTWVVDPDGSSGGWTGGGGTTDGGTTDGGTTDGGTTDGGTTDGGTTDGGTTDGGTTDGGTTDGGTTDGGTTDGGTTDGGTTDGGTTDGGTTDGGTTDGGTTDGGTTDGGTTDGGTTDGGTTDGGTTDGGTTDGGTTDGGTTDGGTTDGGSTDGGGPTTTPCADPTKWAVSYWDNTTLTGPPADEVCEDAVDHNWGFGGPAATAANYFSGQWTKTVNFPAGNYEFTVGADDGVRLWIDGSLVYNRWVDKSFSTETVIVPLSSGNHVIRVDYYEWGGSARLLADWSNVPVCAPDDPQWFGRYYNGTSLSNLKFERYDNSPNFDWGRGQPEHNGDDVGGNNTFSIEWTRTMNFPAPGTYRFTTGSDDGNRLYVNGNRVINSWDDQSYNESIRTAVVEIEDHCQVELTMQYFENKKDAAVSYEVERVS